MDDYIIKTTYELDNEFEKTKFLANKLYSPLDHSFAIARKYFPLEANPVWRRALALYHAGTVSEH